ncbi:class I SAM-dependent methyltransferase [Candidatus Margulisiibacteriota bacterium]
MVKFGNIRNVFSNLKLPPSVVGYRASEQPWDRWALERGRLKGIHIHEREAVENIVSTLPGDQVVVEMGCGTGKILDSLLGMPNVARVVGIDVNETALNIARKKLAKNPNYKKLMLIKGDVNNMPFTSGFATCVVGIGIFSEVPDVDKTFSEVNRILSPGGTLIGEFDSKETFAEHFLKRHGLLKTSCLTFRHHFTLFMSFFPKLFNYLGSKGYARLMFYRKKDVEDIVSRHFKLDFLKTVSYYHFFRATK